MSLPARSNRKQKLSRPVRLGLAALLCFVFASLCGWLLFRELLLQELGAFLIVNQPLQKCDAIYVLGGNYEVRPAAAAALYRQGWAPQILLAREVSQLHLDGGGFRNFTDITVDLLASGGVPRSKIEQLQFAQGVTSTADESRALRTYVQHHPLKRVLVVTSALHTRRAALAIRRGVGGYGTEVIAFPVPDPIFDPSAWWYSKVSTHALRTEYLKYIYYSLIFWPQMGG